MRFLRSLWSWMRRRFRPKHTVQSVSKRLADGFRDGSVKFGDERDEPKAGG